MEIIVSIVLIIGVYYEIKLWSKLMLLIKKKKIEIEDRENGYIEM